MPCLISPVDLARRRCTLLGLSGLLLTTLDGCATAAAQPRPWEPRLSGDAIVLLGEVHDNPQLHALRADVLRRALASGWRPAVVIEQFDIDRQADIDRSRRERPGDVRHLIEQATPRQSGWDWAHYEQVVDLALRFDLPLLAGNLPDAQTGRLVRQGYAAVLGEERVRELGLLRPIDAEWQAAQEREIDAGHCHALPQSAWAGMARAQFARDAVMADVVQRNAQRGVILLAGNGHVRRDIAVPRWLPTELADRLWSVGFVEAGDGNDAQAFDAVVTAAAAQREDPCEMFIKRRSASAPA